MASSTSSPPPLAPPWSYPFRLAQETEHVGVVAQLQILDNWVWKTTKNQSSPNAFPVYEPSLEIPSDVTFVARRVRRLLGGGHTAWESPTLLLTTAEEEGGVVGLSLEEEEEEDDAAMNMYARQSDVDPLDLAAVRSERSDSGSTFRTDLPPFDEEDDEQPLRLTQHMHDCLRLFVRVYFYYALKRDGIPFDPSFPRFFPVLKAHLETYLSADLALCAKDLAEWIIRHAERAIRDDQSWLVLSKETFAQATALTNCLRLARRTCVKTSTEMESLDHQEALLSMCVGISVMFREFARLESTKEKWVAQLLRESKRLAAQYVERGQDVSAERALRRAVTIASSVESRWMMGDAKRTLAHHLTQMWRRQMKHAPNVPTQLLPALEAHWSSLDSEADDCPHPLPHLPNQLVAHNRIVEEATELLIQAYSTPGLSESMWYKDMCFTAALFYHRGLMDRALATLDEVLRRSDPSWTAMVEVHGWGAEDPALFHHAAGLLVKSTTFAFRAHWYKGQMMRSEGHSRRAWQIRFRKVLEEVRRRHMDKLTARVSKNEVQNSLELETLLMEIAEISKWMRVLTFNATSYSSWALHLEATRLGLTHPSVVTHLGELAQLYVDDRDFNSAAELYASVAEAFEYDRIHRSEHYDRFAHAGAEFNVGRIAEMSNNYPRAQQAYRRCMDRCLNHPESDDVALRACFRLALACRNEAAILREEVRASPPVTQEARAAMDQKFASSAYHLNDCRIRVRATQAVDPANLIPIQLALVELAIRDWQRRDFAEEELSVLRDMLGPHDLEYRRMLAWFQATFIDVRAARETCWAIESELMGNSSSNNNTMELADFRVRTSLPIMLALGDADVTQEVWEVLESEARVALGVMNEIQEGGPQVVRPTLILGEILRRSRKPIGLARRILEEARSLAETHLEATTDTYELFRMKTRATSELNLLSIQQQQPQQQQQGSPQRNLQQPQELRA